MTQKVEPICQNCKHHDQGVINNYPWQECKKNWSDKQHGQFYGVIKNTCGNWLKK